MSIHLRLINKSQATNNPTIAVSCVDRTEESVVAWRLIKNIGPGSINPFAFSSDYTINISDRQGNYSPQLQALPGNMFIAKNTGAGNQLTLASHDSIPGAVMVQNTTLDMITVNVFNGGRVCAQSDAPPHSQFMFSFPTSLFIGVAVILQEDPLLTMVRFMGTTLEIELPHVNSADIVMNGGGSTPLTFSLENVR